MEMRLVTTNISKKDLQKLASAGFGNLVKAVVDVKKKIMVVGGELHSDQEKMLLEQGSLQTDLWGINLYPNSKDKDWIEFDSMINLRPTQNNLTRSIDNPKIRQFIKQIVLLLVK